MISGFGPPGQPDLLIEALCETGVTDLTVINNNAGAGGEAISRLFAAKRVRKVVCSFPKAIGSTVFDQLYLAGEIELELVPQGTLAERIRAAGAGVAGFYTPTGYGTELAEGKEVRVLNGRPCVFERPLTADFALVRAHRADEPGVPGRPACGRRQNTAGSAGDEGTGHAPLGGTGHRRSRGASRHRRAQGACRCPVRPVQR